MGTVQTSRLSVEEFKAAGKVPVVIVLDNIRSQMNTGSVFRTADAFRLESLHLCGITATPPHREIYKTALGATDSVHWEYFAETLQSVSLLRSQGYHLVAVEQKTGSIPLHEFAPPPEKKIAFIFGNEVNGIDDSLAIQADQCIEVPQFGTKQSLNIAVCVGIVIWDFFNKSDFFRNL